MDIFIQAYFSTHESKLIYYKSSRKKADAVKTFRQCFDGMFQLWAQTATAVLTPWVQFIPVTVSLIRGLEKAVEGQF